MHICIHTDGMETLTVDCSRAFGEKHTWLAVTHSLLSYGKHLQPFFWSTAYLCPSVIPLLIWLLLFIVSHAISALHLAFAFEHLFCVLPQSLASVWVHVCSCLIFTSVSVCDFFLKARYPSANCARQKIKAGQMRIPATWVPILPSGSDDSWAFLSLVDLFCCLLNQILMHPTPPSLHDLNPLAP